ncbi:phosphotransferase family protein [Paenibacillus sp. PSB04]|uniref:phosphotransferase family protein n=1 Tax=Paenibacillus sp. PSB04 TaxID=2866810 RepID=UPI0021F0B0F5|nr:phosphotransferase [Paenibacillus sp. PSB04]UYO05864.1 phosphotransferase [Paenibacillus sp. PSB04]
MNTDLLGAVRFINSRFDSRAKDIAPVGAGDWSTAYGFTLDGQEMVIRFGAHVEDFQKDQVMGSLAPPMVPVPEVTLIGETSEGFYAVSRRVRGGHLDELDAGEMRLILPGLIDALLGLQQVDTGSISHGGEWRLGGRRASWSEELLSVTGPRDRLPGWRERLDVFPAESKIFDSGVSALRRLAPRLPEYRGIAHCDLLNRNVLVDRGGLTGIIDWGNAIYGDPLYDMAWLLYWWPWYPQWQEIDLQQVLNDVWERQGGFPSQMEERLRCCLLHIGLDHIAYCAFRQRTEDMRRNAVQLLDYI